MSTHLLHVVWAIGAFMAFGTTAVSVIVRTDPARHRDLWARTLSWFPVCIFLIGTLFLGRALFTVGFVWVSAHALFELFRASPRPFSRRVTATSYALIGLSAALLFAEQWLAAMLVLPIAALTLLPLCLVWSEGVGEFGARFRRLLLWVMLGAWSLFALPTLAWLPIDVGAHGWQGLVLFLVVTTQMSDLMQYVVGKIAGRRPLAPRISPGKTWEGAMGGSVIAVALGTLLGAHITPFGATLGFALAIAFCVLGVLGDLAVSGIKRSLGIKDLGALLPGFGGLLDRVDSLVFAAPLFLFFVLVTRLTPGG